MFSQRSLNTVIGGNADSIYLIVSDLGGPSGEGLDFINGQSFLERFYSVYGKSFNVFTKGGLFSFHPTDSDNQRVGLATTPFTFAETN